MPAIRERADGNPLLVFIDSCLRGIGQVCFMNNPVTGLAILVERHDAEHLARARSRQGTPTVAVPA